MLINKIIIFNFHPQKQIQFIFIFIHISFFPNKFFRLYHVWKIPSHRLWFDIKVLSIFSPPKTKSIQNKAHLCNNSDSAQKSCSPFSLWKMQICWIILQLSSSFIFAIQKFCRLFILFIDKLHLYPFNLFIPTCL